MTSATVACVCKRAAQPTPTVSTACGLHGATACVVCICAVHGRDGCTTCAKDATAAAVASLRDAARHWTAAAYRMQRAGHEPRALDLRRHAARLTEQAELITRLGQETA